MRLPSVTTCLWAVGVQGAALGPFARRDGVTDMLAQRQSTVTSSEQQSRAVNTTAVIENGYWLNDLSGKGIAAFNKDPAGYRVFRNVKDYGAVGDGKNDDSDAINKAISDGGRCGPWVCQSSTDTPAVVYIPPGTYRIAKPIVFYYMTQLIGDPRVNQRPILKAADTLDALALIDASPYSNDNGQPAWTSTNIFLRQIRNIVIDGTDVPTNKGFQGIHWPASQATTIQNVKIVMTQSSTSGHAGIFVENGSGGHMADLEIEGGRYGLNIGNQQFTMRNIKISKAQVGISQIWNWGWLYSGLSISDCGTAFQMINGYDVEKLQVGSVVIIDSEITNCPVFMDTTWREDTQPIGAGQLILQKIRLNNVPVAITGYGKTILQGGSLTIDSWGQGNIYTPDRANGNGKFQGTFTAMSRPQGLLDNDGKFYSKSKPQYESYTKDQFISARGSGATGDGKTDDTKAVQDAINAAASAGKVLFFEHGVYKVTNTIDVPPGSRMVGETFSAIMASGSTWADQNNPKPVIRIGKPQDSGTIEWSDMIVQTQGGTPGAIVIEYNLNTERGSGLWDVHTRIGGSKGTLHQVEQCPVGSVNSQCFAAHTNVHITQSAKGAYFENNWFWTADHDLDDWNSTRTAIFTGRGMHVQGTDTFLWASGVEHHALYQYQFNGAQNIFAGFIQTETPYYMPNPNARTQPFQRSDAYSDPDYSRCPADEICDAWGLRVLNSRNVMIYGGGLYSFFKNYDVSCSSPDAKDGYRDCQYQIFSIEGSSSVQWFALNQVGAEQMITINGVDKAKWSDNLSVYSNTIGYFTYNGA